MELYSLKLPIADSVLFEDIVLGFVVFPGLVTVFPGLTLSGIFCLFYIDYIKWCI